VLGARAAASSLRRKEKEPEENSNTQNVPGQGRLEAQRLLPAA
jgi:hypothetical protein